MQPKSSKNEVLPCTERRATWKCYPGHTPPPAWEANPNPIPNPRPAEQQAVTGLVPCTAQKTRNVGSATLYKKTRNVGSATSGQLAAPPSLGSRCSTTTWPRKTRNVGSATWYKKTRNVGSATSGQLAAPPSLGSRYIQPHPPTTVPRKTRNVGSATPGQLGVSNRQSLAWYPVQPKKDEECRECYPV